MTTGVLVGLFGLAEWGAERLLASTTHAESLAAELGIAVALIYAVRMMHERAEGVVERLLFAARHRRIASIAGIAADVDDVASEEEIGRFAVRRLREENGIAAALYRERDGRLALLAGAPEHPPLLSLDDPAVVALRARRGIVHGLPSDLPFPHAYPLLVHGRVIGALACAAPDGGAFAPDEDAALARLAAAVAVALEEFGGRSRREQNLRLGAEVEILRGVLRDLGRSTVEA